MSAKLVLTVKDSSRMAKDYSMSMMDKMFHPLTASVVSLLYNPVNASVCAYFSNYFVPCMILINNIQDQ